MKNSKAFFVIVLFLGLIFSFQEVLATTYDYDSCEDFCDNLNKQYDFSECIEEDGEEIIRACDPYPQFDDDGKYCYYDCAIKNSGDVEIEDCVSHFCLCTKKIKCNSSENNCYNQTGCTSCEGRKSSCESKHCCQQPDVLMCDSVTELCYDPSNNFHCKSNRDCYSDEECMSGKCDFEGTGECECSDRGETCEEYYNASSDSQCVDDFLCNDKYSVCYNEDLNLKEKEETCYHDSECESDSCNFNEQGTSGVCDGADDEGDESPSNGSEPEEPESEPKKPPKPGTCEYYCFNNTEPPKGMVCICNPLSADSFEEIIDSLIDLIFSLSLVIAPLMIVWAGGLYVTSGGNSEQITKAKNIIIYTLTGFAVILLSKGFVAIIKQLLGA